VFLDEIPDENGHVNSTQTHTHTHTHKHLSKTVFFYSLFTLNSGGWGVLLGMGGKVEVCRIYNEKREKNKFTH
jgi:hypothetical protein